MPFSNSLIEQPLIAQAQRLRRNPLAAYGIAVGVVGVATLLRLAISDYLIEGLPFITFYAAIVIVTFLGGWRPGLVALGLSAIASWYFFLPPPMSWNLSNQAIVSLLAYIGLASINIAVVALLNAAIDRIRIQEQNQRTLIESAPNGIVVTDESGTIRLVNSSTERMFGYERRELVGAAVDRLVPKPFAHKHAALREGFHESPEPRRMGGERDVRGLRKDGSEFPLEIGLSPLVSEGHHAVLATVIDISERKQLQSYRELVIDELRHRTKNLFVIAQIIVARSLEEGRSMDDAKHLAVGRLEALAKAYAALGSSGWEGISLAEIVRREFAGFLDRLSLSGCDLRLQARAVEQFSLVLHELATNAIKYGALSNGKGLVAVEGRAGEVDGQPVFFLVWRERGGPPVTAPARRGFGSTVLLDSVRPFALRVAMNFEPDGVVYELDVPLSQIADAARGTVRAA